MPKVNGAILARIENKMRIPYNIVSMRRISSIAYLFCLLAAALFVSAQESMPVGISCCDEQKIRQAMAEEALARVAARCEPEYHGAGPSGDYLSGQAYEKIRKRLPAGSQEQRLAYMRDLLRHPTPDADIKEFQTLVGHFILGMTLEIGNTLQDEYDRAQQNLEKVGKLLSELERSPAAGEEVLGRALFQADLSERELRRIRGLERRWKDAAPAALPFDEFNVMKKNVSGHSVDPDQRMVFEIGARYRARFPFLDEFLENYRRLAADFREVARRLNDLLAASER